MVGDVSGISEVKNGARNVEDGGDVNRRGRGERASTLANLVHD